MNKALATEFTFGAAEREKIMFIDRRNEDRSHTMTDKSRENIKARSCHIEPISF